MTSTAPDLDNLRPEAARLAVTLLRFDEAAAHLSTAATPEGRPRIGVDAYVFLPSPRPVRRDDIAAFLVGLPSPALLAPTMTRGIVSLTLLHELSGERRRSAEKILDNFAACLAEVSAVEGLVPASRVLVEFDDVAEVYSLASVAEYARQFPAMIGWVVAPLREDERADACLMLRRSDGRPFPGRSSMRPFRPGA